MICDMIVISKSVIILSLWVICDVIVKSRSIIIFVLYKRLYIGSLWHKYGKYECQSIVTGGHF